jgi:hypothetical protein
MRLMTTPAHRMMVSEYKPEEILGLQSAQRAANARPNRLKKYGDMQPSEDVDIAGTRCVVKRGSESFCSAFQRGSWWNFITAFLTTWWKCTSRQRILKRQEVPAPYLENEASDSAQTHFAYTANRLCRGSGRVLMTVVGKLIKNYRDWMGWSWEARITRNSSSAEAVTVSTHREESLRCCAELLDLWFSMELADASRLFWTPVLIKTKYWCYSLSNDFRNQHFFSGDKDESNIHH